jgi:multidrug transporter EmrE-like cation transporter
MKTISMIFVVSASVIVSQLLLKRGVRGLDFSCFSVDLVLKVASSPFIIASIALQLSSFVIWLIVISKTNLGYAFGFSGAFLYLLLPLLSWFIYGERLSSLQWIGLVFIITGIVLIVRGNLSG